MKTITYDDGATPSVTNTFDRIGRKATVTQAPEATVQDAISYTYNDAGQVLAEAHTAGLLSGLTVTNAYNSLLQRTSLALNDSGGALHSSAYTWDGAGRLGTVSDGTNSAMYS